jgi:hypothetical protein
MKIKQCPLTNMILKKETMVKRWENVESYVDFIFKGIKVI